MASYLHFFLSKYLIVQVRPAPITPNDEAWRNFCQRNKHETMLRYDHLGCKKMECSSNLGVLRRLRKAFRLYLKSVQNLQPCKQPSPKLFLLVLPLSSSSTIVASCCGAWSLELATLPFGFAEDIPNSSAITQVRGRGKRSKAGLRCGRHFNSIISTHRQIEEVSICLLNPGSRAWMRSQRRWKMRECEQHRVASSRSSLCSLCSTWCGASGQTIGG